MTLDLRVVRSSPTLAVEPIYTYTSWQAMMSATDEGQAENRGAESAQEGGGGGRC